VSVVEEEVKPIVRGGGRDHLKQRKPKSPLTAYLTSALTLSGHKAQQAAIHKGALANGRVSPEQRLTRL